jgi:replicative superfamily II helicase
LRLDLDVPLAAVQGPPGSGKTYIVELLAEEYIVNQLLESNELIFYIAPTNELVFDACVRVLAAIFRKVAPDRGEV